MEQMVLAKDYDYENVCGVIDLLCRRFPFLKRSVIGRSCGGRDIYSLTLGEGERKVLFAAAFHGSERITGVIILKFIEELCESLLNDELFEGFNAKRALLDRQITFVPVVNPDGCEISLKGAAGCMGRSENIYKLCDGVFSKWKANLRGVDINHNFDAGWKGLHKREQLAGIFGPSFTRYGGPRPESEPETMALTTLCRTENFNHAMAIHSQGEVIYYGFEDLMPENTAKMAQILSAVSGYVLEEPEGLAVGGGFKDWFTKEFDRPAFTVEVGRGENPLPSDSMYDIYYKIREMLMVFAVM